MNRDAHALALAVRDRRVPWYAKAVAALVVAYALSPIDLIPDFIPVLGYLDDLLIVPVGIWCALRLVPSDLMNEFRRAAGSGTIIETLGKTGAVLIVMLWIGGLIAVALLLRRAFG